MLISSFEQVLVIFLSLISYFYSHQVLTHLFIEQEYYLKAMLLDLVDQIVSLSFQVQDYS